MLKPLYETFLEERRFLKNCSPKTIRSYQQAWNAFEPHLISVTKPDEIRQAIKAGIVQKMNAGAHKPSSINVYIRALNAFVRWGSTEEHFKPPVKGVPLLKTPIKVVPTLTEAEIQRLVQFKPKHRKHKRAHAMALLILDTGLRLSECLQLEVADVDLDNFLITVMKGKGKQATASANFQRRKEGLVSLHPSGRGPGSTVCFWNADWYGTDATELRPGLEGDRMPVEVEAQLAPDSALFRDAVHPGWRQRGRPPAHYGA